MLFIDDLQWADPSSVALIRRLALDESIGHLLIIGAMRDLKAGDHAVQDYIDAARDRGILDELTLGPLDRDTSRSFVADSLQTSADHVAPLADALHRRTAGNPFFLRTLLADLVAREALRFSRLAATWHWDLERLDDGSVADDVVEFLRERMTALPAATGRVLAAAACAGVSFDLRLVAAATAMSLGAVANTLREAIQQELVLPLSPDYRMLSHVDDDGLNIDAAFPFRFAHDRIQQAAHGLASDAERGTYHQRIGMVLLDQSPGDEAVIDVARHLNQGAPAAEKVENPGLLLGVNLRAGEHARRAGAFEDAWEFLETAARCLPTAAAANDPSIRRGLLVSLAETAYLTGRLPAAESRIDELRKIAAGPVDLAEVSLLQAVQYTTIGRVDAALDAGIAGLAALGLRLKRRPSKLRLARSLLATRTALLTRSLASIRAQPALTEPRPLLVLQLLSRLGVAAYLAGDEDLFGLCVLEGVRFSLRHGHSPETSVFYAAVSIVLMTALGELRAGQRYGDLGLELHQRGADVELRGRVGLLHALFSASWNEHRSGLAERFATALHDALAAGDLLYASFAAAHVHQWNPGWDLERAIAAGERSLAVLHANRHQDVWDSTRLAHQLRVNLCGRTKERLSLSDDSFDAEQSLARMEASGYRTGVTVYHITSLQMCCHYGAFDRAFGHALAAERGLDSVAGQPWMLEFWTYAAIAAAEAARSDRTYQNPDYPGSKHVIHGRRAGLALLRRARRRLSRWAVHCPSNFAHASMLADAEHWAVRDEPAAALASYEDAVDAARTSGFRELEALANERAGAHLLRIGRNTLASAWCTEAWRLYLGWGAQAKAAALVDRWGPHLRMSDRSLSRAVGDTTTTTNRTSRQGQTSGSNRDKLDIDLISVMKASQALSSEIDIDRLLEKMLRIVMENAGAASGLLLLRRGGEMCLQASARDGGAFVEILDGQPMSAWPTGVAAPAPMTVIERVLRAKAPVVIDDAGSDPLTAADPFVRQHSVKSVLCAPIVSQGRMLAVVYLENRAAAGFFSQDRVSVLDLLASQMSISLENALLYRDLVDANAQLGDAFEQQRTLLESYHRFVPREFLALLGRESVTDIELGTHVQAEMTILFSDIRSFTTMSEQMTPEENFGFINAYLSTMEPVIGSHGGFIDKYIGDAIMALFPGQQAQQHATESAAGQVQARAGDDGGATAALDAAIAMLYSLRDFNTRRVAAGEAAIRIGIGLNTGRIMLGTVGGTNRMDGTVISDAVNIASRIEGLTGKYAALLLVSSDTLERVRDRERYRHRFIGPAAIRGKRKQVSLYEFFDGDDAPVVAAKTADIAVFERAVAAFERDDFEAARGDFEACLARCPQDGVARDFLARIEQAAAPVDAVLHASR